MSISLGMVLPNGAILASDTCQRNALGSPSCHGPLDHTGKVGWRDHLCHGMPLA